MVAMYTGMVWIWAELAVKPRVLRIVGWKEVVDAAAMLALK
jgi:hypothetical protein